jgi:hypothetical protein
MRVLIFAGLAFAALNMSGVATAESWGKLLGQMLDQGNASIGTQTRAGFVKGATDNDHECKASGKGVLCHVPRSGMYTSARFDSHGKLWFYSQGSVGILSDEVCPAFRGYLEAVYGEPSTKGERGVYYTFPKANRVIMYHPQEGGCSVAIAAIEHD